YVVGDTAKVYTTKNGNLGLQFRRISVPTRGVNRLARGMDRSLPARAVRHLQRDLRLASMQRRIYSRFLRLPVDKRTVVFESHMGRQYSDSPRYVYEAMKRKDPTIRAVWSYAEEPDGFPEDAVLVKRNTVRWLYELARARVRV